MYLVPGWRAEELGAPTGRAKGERAVAFSWLEARFPGVAAGYERRRMLGGGLDEAVVSRKAMVFCCAWERDPVAR